MHLSPYTDYKDTDLPWLSMIPNHWDLIRGKFLFRYEKELNSDYSNDNVLSLTLRGVVNNNPKNPEGLVPKDYRTYQKFYKNDLVFKLIDLENLRTSRVGIVHETGIMSPVYIRLVPNTPETVRFFFYQYFDLYLREVFNYLGGGVRATLGPNALLDLQMAVPPKSEMLQILQFIETQELQILKVLHTKQQLISLLKELKQVVIQDTVIKGIDASVRLKPSGIEWLGYIPEHWEVFRSRYIFREVNQRSTTGNELHLSMSQRLGLIPSKHIEGRRLKSKSYVGSKICEKDDLVLNRLKAHLGVFAVAQEKGLVSPDYTVFRRCRKILSEYFKFVLKTPACRIELRKRAKGIVEGFWRLYTEDFYDIRLPFPPVEEQKQIISQLEHRLRQLNSALDFLKREIDLISEFRIRLIFDVVTGKLDVRTWNISKQSKSKNPKFGYDLSNISDRKISLPIEEKLDADE